MAFIHRHGCHYHTSEYVTNHIWILLLLYLTLLLSQTIATITVVTTTTTQPPQPQQNNNEVSRNNLDLFNYKGSISAIDNNGIPEYGPSDWGEIKCPNPDICVGFPAKFAESQGWHINSTNFCQSCPDGDSDCGFHHQSPIPLSRTVALPYDNEYYMCADGHWMAYFDSSCSFNELKNKDAFIIDRFALRIIQPIIDTNNDGSYTIDCRGNNNAQWGRIDFANGFPDWWLLSHIDFHVPSEHTQEGKRYSGEIQMYHFYSVPAKEAGVNNEMATVTVFIEEYDDADDWDELNKVICAWREAEEKNREACGIRSVETVYDGCTVYNRTGSSISFDGSDDNTDATGSLDDILKQRLNQSAPAYYNYTIVAPNGTSFAANIVNSSASIYDKLNQRKSPTSSPTYISLPITSTPTTLLPVPIGTYMPSKGPTILPSSTLLPVPSIPTTLPPVIPTTLSSDTPTIVVSDISTDGLPDGTTTSWTILPSSIPLSSPVNTPVKFPSADAPNAPTSPTSSSSTDSIPMALPTSTRKPTRHPRVPSSTQSMVTPVKWSGNGTGTTTTSSLSTNHTSEGSNESSNHTGKNGTTWTSSNASGTKIWTPSTISWNSTDTISNQTTKEVTQDFRNRKLRSAEQKSKDANVNKHYKPATSIYDILHENHYHLSQNTIDFQPRTIKGDENHYDTQDDFDWDGFISNEYRKLEEKKHDSRRLNDYQHVDWFNYFPMAGVKTEYYHRYSGTQTIPPCYGTWVRDSRKQTNHWRVMKDPVRVSPRQIQELHRLLRERIAPSTDPISACKADTAAAPDPYDSSKVNVARPLQQKSQPHFQSFCECSNWHSQWREDIAWCRNNTLSERIYDNPYNFKTDGY